MTADQSNGGLQSNPPLDTFEGMKATDWRERARAEEELLQQLQEQSSQAAKRRAIALMEGVAELKTVAAVARELGKTHTAIATAIKKHGTAATEPTTE